MTRASGHHSHDGHPERGYAEDDDQTAGKPLRNFGLVNWVDRKFLKYEIANLPLADDGATVNIILGCMSMARAVESDGAPSAL
jgi:hypothetical protein